RLGGAHAGDTVAVIGDVGWSAAGYALVLNNIQDFDALRRRHLVPEPPYSQGRVAADAGATSMTDVSDGLVADLGQIARASGVGIDLSSDSLGADRDPLASAGAALAVDPWDWILGGGEDHALVATFPGLPPAGWRVIGRVLDGPARVLLDGKSWHGDPGWQSF
ncbi:MAG: AIR synthase-related protein, partial [Mycobacterium sp.]